MDLEGQLSKGPLQAAVHEGLVWWPYKALEPKDVDESKEAKEAEEAEVAEGGPEEWPCWGMVSCWLACFGGKGADLWYHCKVSAQCINAE